MQKSDSDSGKPPQHRIFRKRMIVISIVVLLIGFRIALEPIVLHYVNKTLSQAEGYTGQVEDVDIKLWRGAYTIEGIKIRKSDGGVEVPLFDGETIDFSIYWRALWKGQIVSKGKFQRCEINFVEGSQTGESQNWNQILSDLAPFNIERLDVVDCAVRLFKGGAEIYVENLNGSIVNLNNSDDLSDSQFATGEFNGNAMKSGDLFLGIKMNPRAEAATFDTNVKLTGVNVTELNPFIKQSTSIDLEEGTFDLIVEMAVQDGQVEGYAKPIFNDLVIYSPEEDGKEDKDGPLKQIGEAVVGIFAKPVTNLPENKLATKIPLSGPVDNPERDGLALFSNLLRNAFVQSFQPNLENSVSLGGPDAAPTQGSGESDSESNKKKDGDKKSVGRKILNFLDPKDNK